MFKFSFGENNNDDSLSNTQPQLELAQPEICSINDLKNRAPRISYSIDQNGIPRRDLFDVRFELMNLDEMSEDERQLLSGSEDVRKNVYEGGLKVWEGTNDLIEVLSKSEAGFNGGNIMELGCGAGIPSCYLFYKALKQSMSKMKLVLADYNSAVLRLLTMPNVVLAWLAATTKLETYSSGENEIILSAALIDEMLSDLVDRGIEVTFVSGAWGKKFSELTESDYNLVLASETIYSLDSIDSFTDVLCRALKPETGRALVAAKRVYFGVGGGIVEFERLLADKNTSHSVILERGNVGRVVLEVCTHT